MQKYFEDLFNTKLERKEPSKFYTLGDEKLDHGFGLDNMAAALTPSKEQIEQFASLTYLFGMLGYKVSEFTAVPAGYLVGLENGGKSGTIIISEGTKSEYLKKIFEIVDEKANSGELSHEEQEFFNLAKSRIDYNERLGEGLIVACAELNAILKNSPELERLNSLAVASAEPINFNSNGSVNKRNCDENQILIERMVREKMGLPLDEESLTEEQIQKTREIGKTLLQDQILPYYRKYMAGSSQILSSEEMIKHFAEVFGNTRRAVIALNICSTDFTADMASYILDDIIHCSNPSEFERHEYPKTPNNEDEKTNARKVINSMGYMNASELDR